MPITPRFHDHLFQILAAVVASLALFGPAIAFAQAAGQWKDGVQIYERVCSYCHESPVAPQILGRNIPELYVMNVVRGGLRAMPAFRPTDFSEAELAALARFIHESKVESRRRPNENVAS